MSGEASDEYLTRIFNILCLSNIQKQTDDLLEFLISVGFVPDLILTPYFGIFVLGASDPDLHHASRNEDDARELVSRPEQA